MWGWGLIRDFDRIVIEGSPAMTASTLPLGWSDTLADKVKSPDSQFGSR